MIDPEEAARDLRRAVEAVYDAMARYRLPGRIDFCSHCVTAEENDVLRRVPLRRLTAANLERYAWKSMGTWGDLADLQHFTPRLLELHVTGELASFGDGFAQKVTSLYQSWPQEAREAINNLFAAWWKATLARYPAPHLAHDVLEVLSYAVGDPMLFLADWEGDISPETALHLADFVDDWGYSAYRQTDWARAVNLWMAGPAPTRALEAATLAADDPQTAQQLSHGYERAMLLLGVQDTP